MRENCLNGNQTGAALGVHPTTISSWVKDTERVLPDYAIRILALHKEVAAARRKAEMAIGGASPPPANRAAVMNGTAEDMNVVVALAERLGITVLDVVL